ncbi:MAG TPA: hypothetical protein VGC88_06835 [Terriglobales bacterium]|jgi:hypothetical protein
MRKNWRTLSIALLCMAPLAKAQTPESSGGYRPLAGVQERGNSASDGTLHSEFRASQIFRSGEGEWQSAEAVSGHFDYNGPTRIGETSFSYEGAASFDNQQRIGSRSLQNLSVSDRFRRKRFTFVLGDTATYSPDTVGGNAGIPGIGNIGTGFGGGGFIPPVAPQQGLLADGVTRVSNAVITEADYSLSAVSQFVTTGSFGILRFPDAGGLDSHQVVASEGFDHRFTARTAGAIRYQFSQFNYEHVTSEFQIHSAMFSGSHAWTARLNSEASIGPEWIDPQVSRTTHNVGASLATTYMLAHGSVGLHYHRGANSGSGVLLGAEQDLVGFNIERELDRNWTVSSEAAYIRATGLTGGRNFSNESAGVQINRKLAGEHLGAYFSYTYRHQNADQTVLGNGVLHGDSHTFGMGFTFTPRGIRLGRS